MQHNCERLIDFGSMQGVPFKALDSFQRSQGHEMVPTALCLVRRCSSTWVPYFAQCGLDLMRGPSPCFGSVTPERIQLNLGLAQISHKHRFSYLKAYRRSKC